MMPGTVSPSAKPQTILRAALPKDVEAIANLGSHVFSTTFGYSLPVADLNAYLTDAYSLSSIASDLSNPNIDIIVACDSLDHVMGFAQLTRGTIEECVAKAERPVELQRLYVAQGYHGRGVGKALVDRVEEMARGQGFKTMWLGVWEDNFKAQKVYERLGFGKVGEHDFKMGESVQTDWILSKNL
jgi:ribosomal protein S18 acetylase RimI-like enzyme